MKGRRPLSVADKLTVAGLIVAAVGVSIQIASGHDYPMIPPVFFILLIPAALIALGRLRWAPAIAALAGLFLTFGLFASGESARLFGRGRAGNPGDSIGLWVQMLAVIAATVFGTIATIRNHRARTKA